MRHGRFVFLLLPLTWALACGGRFEQTVDDDVSGAAGVATSASGKSGKGGKTSSAGVPGASGSLGFSGGTSTGGSISSAGVAAAGGATCACDPIACGGASMAVPNPNGCCYHCEVDSKLCAQQRQDYANYKQHLIEKFSSFGCMIDADCSTVYDKNECGAGCGFALPVAARRGVDDMLNLYAREVCSPECPFEIPPCAPTPAVRCVMGRCL